MRGGGGGGRVGKLTDVPLVGRGGEAREMPDMLPGRLGPVDDDDDREEKTAEGVKPPYPRVETDCYSVLHVSNPCNPYAPAGLEGERGLLWALTYREGYGPGVEYDI